MLFRHPDHAGRAVRLAYCLNLHPAEDLDGLLAGMRRITLPLRERLAPGAPFGVGLYLPAELAARLVDPAGAPELARLYAFLDEHGLDPFTYNAFPAGGFDRAGLKQRVFEPTWLEIERARFTRDVARIAVLLAGVPEAGRHLSISTHSGGHVTRVQSDSDRIGCAGALSGSAGGLSQLERESGWRTVLSVEPEPRSLANDTGELAGLFALVRTATAIPDAVARHLGTCLDTCHAAVEYETPEDALAQATQAGAPLGKLQFTSALELLDPRSASSAVERLLALDEPRYLHQVTGRGADGLERVGDLSDLGAALADPARREAWIACESWRCHFHVPVDLGALGALGTTRAAADATLAHTLARPAHWGTDELHVEIETYTWDVLPGEARGDGELVDGLEREYRHVLARLAQAGWVRA